jgi:hypothetical protein
MTILNSSTDDLHNRPGKINLSHLFAFNKETGRLSTNTLAGNLMQHHDYEVISLELWRYLVAWYGIKDSQKGIFRPMERDGRTGKLVIDLYFELSQTKMLQGDDSFDSYQDRGTQ